MRNYECGLKKSELEHGAYYKGKCRNTSIARWNSEKQIFYYWRYKFGWFLETIKHYEDETIFDVFNAFEKIEKPEEDENFYKEILIE